MHSISKKSLLLILITTFMTITGCNTMQGMGRDLQQGGEVIERAADKA